MSWQKENLFNWLSSPNDEEHPAAKKVCMLYTSKRKRKRRKEDHVSACPVPARVQLSQEKGGKIGCVLVVIYTIERKEEKEKGEKAKKVVRRRRGSWRRERCEKKKICKREKIQERRREEKKKLSDVQRCCVVCPTPRGYLVSQIPHMVPSYRSR